jgi:hypothetical protein
MLIGSRENSAMGLPSEKGDAMLKRSCFLALQKIESM